MLSMAIMMTNGKFSLVVGGARNMLYVMEIEVLLLLVKAIQIGRIFLKIIVVSDF